MDASDRIPRLKNLPGVPGLSGLLHDTTADEFHRELTRLTRKIRISALALLDAESAKELSENSKLEALVLYDENDRPYRRPDGSWAVEMRKDFRGTTPYQENRLDDLAFRNGRIERITPHCRVVFFVVERENGKVLFAKRGDTDSDSGRMELSGGHVANGGGYLDTCTKEVFEEFGFRPLKEAVDFGDAVSKFAAWIPDDLAKKQFYSKQRGIHGVVFRIIVADGAVPDEKREIKDADEMTPEEMMAWLDLRIENLAAGRNNPEDLDIAVHHIFGFLKYLEKRGFDKAARLTRLAQSRGYNINREFPV